MKKEYIKLFSFMIGVALLLSAVVYAISNSYKGSKQKAIENEKKILEEIGSAYASFSIKLEEFSNLRDKTIADIEEYSSYYTGMDTKYDEIIVEVKEYDKAAEELKKSIGTLSKRCVNISYSDSVVNQKCINFIMNYEKSINTFVGDMSFFNSKVDTFNKWVDTENESKTKERVYKKVDNYTATSFKDYIDVNKDGTYLGKKSS